MPDDLIVVVPPGTRVRYVESPYTEGKLLVLDASLLHSIPVTADLWSSMSASALFGLPVYEAEKYLDD